MLRDNLVGSSHRCLENPRPTRAEPSLTEDVTSPFQAEPRHMRVSGVSIIVRLPRQYVHLVANERYPELTRRAFGVQGRRR
jgi:hypothetical protein